MTDHTAPQYPEPSQAPEVDPQAVPPLIQSSARWFWWIAGLSLVNSLMSQSGSGTSFVMGLGLTAVLDAILVHQKYLNLILDVMVVGLFVIFGYQARLGKLWALGLGIVLYALDTLIYVFAKDWMPVAFHGLALFFLFKGAMAQIAWRKNA